MGGTSIFCEPFARDRSHRLDTWREGRRDEHPERGVELDARAGLREQRVRGLASSRGDDEVALDLVPVDEERSDATAPTLGFELAHGRLAQVDDALHRDSRLA